MKRGIVIITIATALSTFRIWCNSIKHLNNTALSILIDGREAVWQIIPPLSPCEQRWVSVSYSRPGHKSFYADIFLVGDAENLGKFIITELTTKGNVRKQDRLELCCTESGSAEGVSVFYNGNVLTLGKRYFKKGEHIDFELTDGLSNNNGYIEIHSNPGKYSSVMDKVFYTDSKKKNEVFDNNWQGVGVDVTLSSTKKSIQRKLSENGEYIDTNTADDFSISSQSNFGKINK